MNIYLLREDILKGKGQKQRGPRGQSTLQRVLPMCPWAGSDWLCPGPVSCTHTWE